MIDISYKCMDTLLSQDFSKKTLNGYPLLEKTDWIFEDATQ